MSDPVSPPPTARRRTGRATSRAAFGAVILVLVAAAFAAAWWVFPPIDPTEIIARLSPGPVGIALLLIAMMIAHNFVPVPAEVIAICAGGLLGIVPGILVVWIGAMLGAGLAFALARSLGRTVVARYVDAGRIARLDATVQRWGAPGLLGVRLLPIVSFNLVNYGAGLCNVGWFTFLWTTALGILPVLVLSVVAGEQIERVAMGPWFALVVAALALIALLWHRSRRSSEAES